MLSLSIGDTSAGHTDGPEPGPEVVPPSSFLTHTAWLCLSFGSLVALICPRLDALLSARLPTVESQLFARHFGLSMLLVGTLCSVATRAQHDDADAAAAVWMYLTPVLVAWHAAVAAAFAVEIGWLGTYRSSPPVTRALACGGALAHVAVLVEGVIEGGFRIGFEKTAGDICATVRSTAAVALGTVSASAFAAAHNNVAIRAMGTVACIIVASWLFLKRRRPSLLENLDGELVVVTGAAGGIGRELALAFGREGATLALWDVRAEALDRAVKWLEGEGLSSDRIRTAVVDVSDANAVTAAAKSLRREESRAPRVVVSNAAVMRGASLLEATDEELRSDFAVNTLAAFWLARSFLRQMLDEKTPSPRGVVVTVGSIMADLPAARQAEYCASKAALSQLHECLRWELRANPNARHVRSLLVQPYAVETPMIAGAALLGVGVGDEARHRRFAVLRKLLPPLRPERVARRIVRAVRHGEERVYVPAVVGWAPVVLSLLPRVARDAILNAAGASDGMHGFRGCAPPRTAGKTG